MPFMVSSADLSSLPSTFSLRMLPITDLTRIISVRQSLRRALICPFSLLSWQSSRALSKSVSRLVPPSAITSAMAFNVVPESSDLPKHILRDRVASKWTMNAESASSRLILRSSRIIPSIASLPDFFWRSTGTNNPESFLSNWSTDHLSDQFHLKDQAMSNYSHQYQRAFLNNSAEEVLAHNVHHNEFSSTSQWNLCEESLVVHKAHKF